MRADDARSASTELGVAVAILLTGRAVAQPVIAAKPSAACGAVTLPLLAALRWLGARAQIRQAPRIMVGNTAAAGARSRADARAARRVFAITLLAHVEAAKLVDTWLLAASLLLRFRAGSAKRDRGG